MNKERSEKSLILVFFKFKQCNNYVISSIPVYTENGPYIYVPKTRYWLQLSGSLSKIDPSVVLDTENVPQS